MNTLHFNFLEHFKRLERRERRILSVAAALALAVAVIAIAAVGVTANTQPFYQLQIRSWVSELSEDRLTLSRQEAQRNLEMAGDAAVPALLSALRSDNSTLRRNAADMLGYIASPQATSGLISALKTDPVPTVRSNAAWALGQIRDLRAWNDLVQASVTDKSPLVRGAASDSLARIKTSLALSLGINDQTVGGIAVSPSQPERVYLSAKRDVYVSTDSGRTWSTLDDTLPSIASTLAVNPAKPQELLAGVDGLGIYKSEDGGITWRAVNTGLDQSPGARTVVSAIAYDPTNPEIVYIARGVWLGTARVEYYPIGLWASYDGGESWQEMTTGFQGEPIRDLAFREGQLYGLAGDRVLMLLTPR